MRTIPLTQGYVALVDDDDYERIAAFRWQAMRKRTANGVRVCAIRSERVGVNRRRTVYMHREILGAPDHLQVDHANGDPLDNRRSNLRLCTNQQNQANVRKAWGGTSRFKGVHLLPNGRWVARIGVGYRRIALGVYATEEDAAAAYDQAARRHFGPFALVNLPDWPTAERIAECEAIIALKVRQMIGACA